MKKIISALFCSLFCLLLSSCSKWVEVKTSRGQTFITNLKSEISEIEEDEWSVGINRKETISKGFKLVFKIPKIKPEDAKKIGLKNGPDSWLIRVNRVIRSRGMALGHILYSIEDLNSISDSVTTYIYYHSAAASSEFRRQSCPAFKHRKKIREIQLIDKNEKEVNLYINRKSQYSASNIERPSFSPIIFSGDRSLNGSYYIDFALYNSKTKYLHSKWIKMSNKVVVQGEIEISVPSCRGVTTEDNIGN